MHNFVGNVNDVLTVIGNIPDLYQQAEQLVLQIRPEYRSKVVLTGHSLGGGLSAYAAYTAARNGVFKFRTVAFDPLGLNRNMLDGKKEADISSIIGGAVKKLTDMLDGKTNPADGVYLQWTENFIDWYLIRGSFVAEGNASQWGLTPVGKVWELKPHPDYENDKHVFENIYFGLLDLWNSNAEWRNRQI